MREPVMPTLPAGAWPQARPLSYAPKPDASSPLRLTLQALEALLADWFERPVLLLGSGRAGIIIYSMLIGAHRHRDTCHVPPYLPACVTDTISRYAFPQLTSENPAFTLLNHQYGFPQIAAPDGRVLEDICHAFFGSSSAGARRWKSDAAIFSLPKFFGINGMGGGLVLASEALKSSAREILGRMPLADPASAAFVRDAVTGAKLSRVTNAGAYVEAAYALLMHFVHPDPASLAGAPDSFAELKRTSEARKAIIEGYLGRGARGMPRDFAERLSEWVPFAFPYFGAADGADETRLCAALAQAGIEATAYHVDAARNMFAPDYRRCVLVPCHQDIPAGTREAVVAILAGD